MRPALLLAIALTACAGRAGVGGVEPPALRAERVRLAIAVADRHADHGDYAAAQRLLDDSLATVGGDPAAEASLLAARGRLAADRTFGDLAVADEGARGRG